MKASVKNKKIIIPAAIVGGIIVIAAVILLILRLNADKVTALADAGIDNTDSVTLISHRGMNVLAPENTLEAAQKTAELGYEKIEFDIRQTADGIWVLMHDEDIKRTTNGKGKVSDMTYKQLLNFNIDTPTAKKFGRVTIPTYENMLRTCDELGLHPVIEIKQSGTEFIRDLLDFTGYRSGDCTIITFDRAQAEEISRLIESRETSLFNVGVEIYWLVSDLSNETLQTALTDSSIGVSFNGNKAGTAEEIKKFTDAGLRLATWTIDDPERLAELYACGITTFTTNSITPSGILPDTTDEVTNNERQ